MSEQTSSVTFRVPDFVDSDGVEYTDIEVVVQMESDIRSTATLAKTLDRIVGDGVQVKAAKKPSRQLGPTQFAAKVERLKAEGKMPSLERLLVVIAETRKLSVPQLLTARMGRKGGRRE
jgi:hypothetical protein